MSERDRGATPVLSVLDLSIGRVGAGLSTALAETISLADFAEGAGYHRFLVGENHNVRSLASTSPAVLISAIAQRTSRIRVGAGCVLLSNHPPLGVAETFRVLNALYPGRIDLGLGRAPGGDPLAALALRQQGTLGSEDEFIDRLADLYGFVDGLPAGHPYAGVAALPDDVPLPEVWIFGYGRASARMAALAGVGYGSAGHLASDFDSGREAIATYQRLFEPSGSFSRPCTALSVNVFCAETASRAHRLADAYAVALARHAAGGLGLLVPAEEADRSGHTEDVATARARLDRVAAVGTPDQVTDRLLAIAGDLGADELILTTGIYSLEERIRCFGLIAENWPATVAVGAA